MPPKTAKASAQRKRSRVDEDSETPAPALPKLNTFHKTAYVPAGGKGKAAQFPVVDRETWLAARRAVLAKEKDVTRAYDAMIQERRKLPWVELKQSDYTFKSVATGKSVRLSDIVSQDGSRPLIIQYLMWDPAWAQACCSCCMWMDALDGILPQLSTRADVIAVFNHPDLKKLKEIVASKGWKADFYSCAGTSFGDDIETHQSKADLDAKKPLQYNYTSGPNFWGSTEYPGFVCISRQPGSKKGPLYLTYGTFGRGLETLCPLWAFLDMLPTGRAGTVHVPHKEETEIFKKQSAKK